MTMTSAQRKVVWIWLGVFVVLTLFPPNLSPRVPPTHYEPWQQWNDILFALSTPIQWDVLALEQFAALVVAAVCFFMLKKPT
jgi:hypothetical protein